MSENPYQSPAAPAERSPACGCDAPANAPRVEGDYLVVPPGTVLPPICVRTNQPVCEKDMIRQHHGPWRTFSFGLHPQIRKKYRRRFVAKILVTIAILATIPILPSRGAAAIASILGLVWNVVLIAGNSPLSTLNRRGRMIWIKGCSKEYLAGLASAAPPGYPYL